MNTVRPKADLNNIYYSISLPYTIKMHPHHKKIHACTQVTFKDIMWMMQQCTQTCIYVPY
jgi:hypothetical protein